MIHVFVICWTGYEERAMRIASETNELTKTTVIYSNKTNSVVNGEGHWIQVPDDWFYGKKFRKSLDLLKPDETLLHIQADAECSNWKELIMTCQEDMDKMVDVGVWAPFVDFTPYTPNLVNMAKIDDRTTSVLQTDGIVWAISKDITKRLAQLGLEKNNLGWGIDLAAAAISLATNKLIVRNDSIKVFHPRGSGYNIAEAETQMDKFLDDLTAQEKTMVAMVIEIISTRKYGQKNKSAGTLHIMKKILRRFTAGNSRSGR